MPKIKVTVEILMDIAPSKLASGGFRTMNDVVSELYAKYNAAPLAERIEGVLFLLTSPNSTFTTDFEDVKDDGKTN